MSFECLKKEILETYEGVHHRLNGMIATRVDNFLVVANEQISADDERSHGEQRLFGYFKARDSYIIVLQKER
jgi:hypothetical protein